MATFSESAREMSSGYDPESNETDESIARDCSHSVCLAISSERRLRRPPADCRLLSLPVIQSRQEFRRVGGSTSLVNDYREVQPAR